jgi:hypothetical protein
MNRATSIVVTAMISFGLGLAVAGRMPFPWSKRHAAVVDPGPIVQLGSPSQSPRGSGRPAPTDLASILREHNSYRMMSDLTAYADALPAADLPKAVARAQALSREVNQPQAMQVLVGRWAETDPEGALAVVTKSKEPFTGQQLVAAVFSALAERDPADALARAKQLPAAGPSSMMQMSFGSFGRQWSRITGPSLQSEAVEAVLTQWAATDPAKALEASQKLPAQAGNSAIPQIFTQWATRDLESATQAALDLPNDDDRANALAAVMDGAKQDLDAERSIVEQIPAGRLRQQAEQGYVSNLAGSDPEAAADYVAQLPNDQTKTNLIQNVASQWAMKDAEAALDWVEKLPLAHQQNDALSQVFSRFAQDNPQAAATEAAPRWRGSINFPAPTIATMRGRRPSIRGNGRTRTRRRPTRKTCAPARQSKTSSRTSPPIGPRPIPRRR